MFAHVDPLRIGAARVEGDSEGQIQAGGEHRNLLRFAVLVAAAEDFDLAQVGFGDEEVAVGGGADLARLVEIGGVHFDLESGGCLRPGVGGTRNQAGEVRRGRGREGLGESVRGDLAESAGLQGAAVDEGGWSGEETLHIKLVELLGGGVQHPTSGEKEPATRLPVYA